MPTPNAFQAKAILDNFENCMKDLESYAPTQHQEIEEFYKTLREITLALLPYALNQDEESPVPPDIVVKISRCRNSFAQIFAGFLRKKEAARIEDK